ncbi:MAG: helix-turn-helix domain-containing protein [Lachnospiraceae bacterium]|nr:helix-turn-helix domain-containing protein [Lachnospiraceae bacterium]
MKIADAKSFGEAIRKRRKELHYTQSYLSACTGLSITFISDLERGKPSIQLEKAIQLVNILGMDLLIEKRGE